MKNSPRPLFLLHQTLQLALCIGADSVLLASEKPRLIRWIARWCSVIRHARECSRVQHLQLTHGTAHGDLRFVCGCSAMETNFTKLPTNSSCADVASRGSLELGSVLFCELVWPTFTVEPLWLLDVSTSQ